MNDREYESSIDLIKIIACILVVGLHTLRGNLGVVNYVFVQIAIISVPLFFVVNGYLLFRKTEITYVYILKKIGNILKVCLFWEFSHACLHFIFYQEIRNFVQSFFYDFIQKGLFYHFWFLGALILIYLVLPFIHKIERENPRIYLSILIGLALLCAGVHIGQLVVGEKYILNIIQTFRIWIWLFYFMAGGWIYKQKEIKKRIKMINPGLKFLLLIIIGMCVIVWEYGMGMYFFGSGYMNEAYHGAFITMITTIAVFVLISQSTIPQKISVLIKMLAKTTMGVYIIHPFILAVLTKVFPIVTENSWMNLCYWIITYAICVGITLIINRIPGLRLMIKL